MCDQGLKAPSHYNELKERTVNEWQKSEYAELCRRINTGEHNRDNRPVY